MDFDRIKCRACLSESEHMHDLFEGIEGNLTLAIIIQKFLNVELSLSDGLSCFICLECAQIIVQFYNFSITFEENNKIENFLPDDVIIDLENDLLLDDQTTAEIFCDGETPSDPPPPEPIFDDAIPSVSCEAFDPNTNSEKDDDLKQDDETKPKYICDICGHVSYKKSYLADHMDIHTNEPKYRCEFCSKAFRRRATLSRHRRIHTKPKHFICEKCGQKFNDRSTLKTHIFLVHMRAKNFHCAVCAQTFSLKSTLHKHMRRHDHKDGAVKQFSCTQCGMKYYDKSSLNRHCTTKHRINP